MFIPCNDSFDGSVSDGLRQINNIRRLFKGIELDGVLDIVLTPHRVELVLEVFKANASLNYVSEEKECVKKVKKRLNTYLRCNPKIQTFSEQEGLTFEPVVRRVDSIWDNSIGFHGFIVFSVKD
jgi:hypothetical protein